MAYGYQTLYSNGLNSNSQIRRSADFVYQRGGTYEVVLTGTTLETSVELVVDLYGSDTKVGTMALVPYDTSLSGSTYYYKFNIRPYQYMQNYVNSEHYQYYWLDDFDATSQTINVDAPYSNGVKANFKYGYRYFSGNTYIYEYTGGTVTTDSSLFNKNDYNHYTYLPQSVNTTGFTPSDYVSTGNYFDYVGGTFQFNNNYILQNFDQEVGSIIGTGFTANTINLYSKLSPIGQYLMDYPTVPEQSETGRFLTNSPRIQYIQGSENYVLYYLNGQSGDRQVIEADYAVYQFYDSNNNLLQTYNQELNKLGTAYESPLGNVDTLKRFALPCGPADIVHLFSGVTWTDVAYYRVQLCYSYPTWNASRSDAGPIGPLSEIFYFYLYANCLPESTRLAWLNDAGGYDYYTFQSYRQDTKKIDRTSYDNRYYATNIASPDRNIGRSQKTFDTNVTQEIVLESNYISVSQAQWLEGLFVSPQVYVMGNDFVSPIDRQNKIYKDLNPVQVISTEVDTITKKHKKLNKYRITLKTGDSFFVNKGF
jgi:hypothetical protein